MLLSTWRSTPSTRRASWSIGEPSRRLLPRMGAEGIPGTAQGSSAAAIFDMSDGVVFTYRGSWCADGLRTSWESAWRIVGERGTLVWDGYDGIRAEVLSGGREGLFDRVEPVAVPPLDPARPHRRPSRRDAGLRRGGRDGSEPETRGTDNIKSLAMVFGAIESAETGRRVADHRLKEPSVCRTRFSTFASARWCGPTSPIRPPMSAQILPLGFESIQPFFWQTLGGKDIPRLAGEIREAIGDADVVVSSLGMFGNPLEDEPTRPRDARGLGDADRQRASLRHRHRSPASPAASAASR